MIRANDNISLPGFYLIQTLMKHIYLILYIFVMIIYSCSSPSNGINIDDDTSIVHQTILLKMKIIQKKQKTKNTTFYLTTPQNYQK